MGWVDENFVSKSLLTAQGQIIHAIAAATPAALPPGTSGQFLKTQGVGANPLWAAIAAVPILTWGNATAASRAFNVTHFLLPNSGAAGTPTEVNAQIIAPRAGILKNFHVRVTVNTLAGGSLGEYCRVRVNGANTGIQVTPGYATGTFSDLVNTYAVAAGDRISFLIIADATAGATTTMQISVELA